jgi:molybdate transport system permease protein
MTIQQATQRLYRLPSLHRHSHRLVVIVLALPLLALIVLPIVSLLLHVEPLLLWHHLRTTNVAQAVSLSMATSTITTVVALIVGTPTAYILSRYQFRGRMLIETLLEIPMVLPPAVAGVALLMAFGRRGIVGSYLGEWGIEVAFSQTAVVLAQLFVAAPFYVKAAVVGLSKIDREVEQAAALDGAGPWTTFRHITLPLAWPALFGGAVMTWARALGEFGATIIFAGNFPGRTQTMPLAIYLGFELELNVALTLAIILLSSSFAVLIILKGFLRQRIVGAS